MRYVAAYLLAVLGGNQNPSKGDIEKILSAVGLEIDDDKIDKVLILFIEHILLNILTDYF